ncbi:fimbrial protein [Dryocola sp. BD626]|uniref:fimbrial protein n=1 Tax=Dryocola sp. BD626 TaxID=3133273 RepID=UPI003F507102
MKMTSFFKMSVLAAGMVAAMGANAADGKLQVTGTVIQGACAVDASSTTDVSFDEIQGTTFNAVGAVSQKKDITLNLTGCPTAQTGVMFTAGGAVHADNDQLLAISSPSVTGLGIAIYNKGGEIIPMRSTSAPAAIDPDSGTATINLEAAAMSTAAAVTGGDFTATSSFVLTYN